MIFLKKKKNNYFNDLFILTDYISKSIIIIKEILNSNVNFKKELEKKKENIYIYKNNSNEIVNKIFKNLYITFITPIEHEHILEIANELNNLLYYIYYFIFSFYYLEIFEINNKDFIILLDEIFNFINKANYIVNIFKFKNIDELLKILNLFNILENKINNLYFKNLYLIFKKINKIEIIKWNKILNILNKIIYFNKKIVNKIKIIIIKNN